MQVTHGETFFFPCDQYVREGRVHLNQASDIYPLNAPVQRRDRSYSEQCVVIAGKEQLTSNVSHTATLPAKEGRPACVTSLRLRAELLKLSSFLQRLAPDRVVLHNDSVSARLQRRLDDGAEARAFVAFDVERLIDQWAAFEALLPGVTPSVRATAASRHVLAAMVHSLGVLVDVDSPAGLSLLHGCVEDAARVVACSPHVQPSRADFAAACGVDTAVARTSSGIRRALLSGVPLMCVGSGSGIRSIGAGMRAIPRDQRAALSSPGLLLCVRDAASVVDSTAQLAAGSSLLQSGVMCFSPEETAGAVLDAQRVGLAVVGVHADVSTLLDGTVKQVLATILSAAKSRRPKSLTVVLKDLDASLALAADNSQAVFGDIRAALKQLQVVFTAVTVTVQADISNHLLGSNQTLLTRVIGARPSVGDDGSVVGRQLYVDDGIYGSLCSRAKASAAPAFSVGYDQEGPLPFMVERGQVRDGDTSLDQLPCTIWGQTCDSLDKVMVADAGLIPAMLGLGDWLSFAVPMCAGNETNTGFNGYDAPLTRFMVHTGFE